MDKSAVKRLLSALPQGKVGVLGDFCCDVYWDIAPEKGEKSLETGLVTIPVVNARYAPGGAGNIVENLRGIGLTDIPVFGALGSDPFGLWLRRNLTCDFAQYNDALLDISRPDYATPTYCKPLLEGVEQPRIDLGNTPISDKEADQLLELLPSYLDKLAVLILNEQIPCSLHTPYFRKRLAEILTASGKTVVFDGRDYLDEYPGVTLKINANAASFLAFGVPGRHPEESGREIFRRNAVPLVITDGENGCYVFEEKRMVHLDAVKYSRPVDTVGAGDSFTAGFAYALACGSNLVEAAGLGTLCSAVTIRKLNQTGSPTPEELLALAD